MNKGKKEQGTLQIHCRVPYLMLKLQYYPDTSYVIAFISLFEFIKPSH